VIARLLGTLMAAADDGSTVGVAHLATGTSCPLIYRWNGRTWRQTWAATTPQDAAMLLGALKDGSFPSDMQNWGLSGWDVAGLAPFSATDVWAVVAQLGCSGARLFQCPSGLAAASGLALHWDGKAWRVAAGMPCRPAALSAVSPADMWVLGNPEPAALPNACHWDGAKWQAAPIVLAG
jgi:hypothetical protein